MGMLMQGRPLAAYLEREGIRWLVDVTLSDSSLAPLTRYPVADARQVEARYRLAARFVDACPPTEPSCRAVAVWAAAPTPRPAASPAGP